MEDRLDKLNKRLKEVHDKFMELKKCGIDEEILIIYLQKKLDMSRRDIKRFLDAFEDFHRKLVSNLAADEL